MLVGETGCFLQGVGGVAGEVRFAGVTQAADDGSSDADKPVLLRHRALPVIW